MAKRDGLIEFVNKLDEEECQDLLYVAAAITGGVDGVRRCAENRTIKQCKDSFTRMTELVDRIHNPEQQDVLQIVLRGIRCRIPQA